MRANLALASTLSTTASARRDAPIPLAAAALRAVTRPLADGLSLGEHLLAGAAAAGTAVASMHPLDTLKTVIQSAPAARGGPLAGVLRAHGVRGLYRGLGVSLSGQVPAGAIKFAAFETLTQLAARVVPRRAGTAAVDFTCAALAFVCCSVVLVPGELLKQRLQAGLYPGLPTAVREIMTKEGPRAFFTGYGATLLRDVPYTMLEFGLYSQFKRVFRAGMRREKLTAREEIVLGGAAGGCTGFLTTPLDLAKTRLMTGGGEYKSVLDVLVRVGRSEGVRGLFKGGAARTAWLVPFTAVFFGVHEASKRALLERKVAQATANKL